MLHPSINKQNHRDTLDKKCQNCVLQFLQTLSPGLYFQPQRGQRNSFFSDVSTNPEPCFSFIFIHITCTFSSVIIFSSIFKKISFSINYHISLLAFVYFIIYYIIFFNKSITFENIIYYLLINNLLYKF